MNFPCYWPYGLPPEFVQCVRSFAEAHLRRQLQHSVFTIKQPIAPPRVCSDWYVPSQAISEAAAPKKRRRSVRVAALQASAADEGDPQQAEARPTTVVAWARVRVGTAGFIAKLLERFFTRRGLEGRDAGKFVRFTLRRTCSVCVCSRAFPSMRARPCRADSTLIVVRCRVSAHTLHLIPNDLQQVAKAFLRDRDLGHYSLDIASDLGDLYSVAASLDSGQKANGLPR
jgi:hypothetical protein